MLKSVYRRNPNMVFREIAGELILVPIRRRAEDTDSIYVLNETGAALWKMLDGESSLEAIISGMLEQYDVDRATLCRDIEEYVKDMIASGALEEV